MALTMDRVVARFRSFQEADEADRLYYRQMTPEQRLDILLETIALYRESEKPSES